MYDCTCVCISLSVISSVKPYFKRFIPGLNWDKMHWYLLVSYDKYVAWCVCLWV